MAYRFIRIAQDGRLTTITIARAASHNALSKEAHEELEQAFDAFEADDQQWVAIITGDGEKAFCAGHDLKQQVQGDGIVLPRSGFGGLTSRFGMVKPVIAAVNGAAMGGGFEIALACDIIVASENAKFALPEPKVGLAALAGGMQRLPRQIGLKRAMGMMLTGRAVSANEGLQLGFVNEVVPAGELLDCARRWADDIIACSPLSLRATKQAALAAQDVPLEASIAAGWDLPAMKKMLGSEDAIEGPKAFAERRTPAWQGR